MRQTILFILDSFTDATAGTESQLLLLLRKLDRNRFDPRVALLRGGNGLSRHVADVPVEVLSIGQIRSIRSWQLAWRYARAGRRRGARLAHIFLNDASVIFPLPLRLAGFRVVISRRDLGFWYTPLWLHLLRLSGRFVDAVVCNSEAVRQVVIEHEAIPPERTTVIYNGIARESVRASRDVERRRLGLPLDAFVIALVANLRPLKRIDTAIRALSRLTSMHPAPRLVIAGADRAGASGASHRKELESLASSLGVGQLVHFVGPVSDPMSLLSCCDAGVLCSETEGLSNSVIEYLQARLPVLCTPVGGNRELIAEGETGYFFGVGDDEALARRLCDLSRDSGALRRMGDRAAQIAEARFAPHIMVSAHEALYSHLMQRRRPGGSSLQVSLPPASESSTDTLRGDA